MYVDIYIQTIAYSRAPFELINAHITSTARQAAMRTFIAVCMHDSALRRTDDADRLRRNPPESTRFSLPNSHHDVSTKPLQRHIYVYSFSTFRPSHTFTAAAHTFCSLPGLLRHRSPRIPRSKRCYSAPHASPVHGVGVAICKYM